MRSARRRRERPGERDALLLAARQRLDPPLVEAGEPDERRAARRPALRSARRRPPLHAQPEGHVAGDVAVGEERVVLEHEAEPTPVRGTSGEIGAVPATRGPRRAARARRRRAAASSCRNRSGRGRPRPRRRRPRATAVERPRGRRSGRPTSSTRSIRTSLLDRDADPLDEQHRDDGHGHEDDARARTPAPTFSRPGRPRKRKMATGTVGGPAAR